MTQNKLLWNKLLKNEWQQMITGYLTPLMGVHTVYTEYNLAWLVHNDAVQKWITIYFELGII